jgi:class 3 adenylate cyclase
MSQSRQLAAIMFTDIQGYTAIMQRDEHEAIEIRGRHREVFDTVTPKHHGRILQYYGDGTLSVFDSAVEAVNCAVEMQKLFQNDPLVPVRIGIHLGDIVLSGDEVIGDAVNIASRIESIAKVGSVLISGRVQMELRNHEDIQTETLGHFSFKNVQQPMEVFAVVHESLQVPKSHEMSDKGRIEQVPFHKLPKPATHFFGREIEMQEVIEQLTHNRLVTLVGPGGCGKTRLAIETARQLSNLFPDGIWFVGLAAVTNPELVSETIAEALQIKPEKELSTEDTITHRISNKKLLMVIDNCEHVIDEAARILDLLIKASDKPRILATSRETLNIPGEAVYRIPPLPVPEPMAGVKEILTFESVQLFLDRVLLHKPDFKLDQVNGPAISAICHKLQGIPLALEMAASRIKIMDPEMILSRLSDQFRLLAKNQRFAPQHQQTMRATIDWSYDLLSDE